MSAAVVKYYLTAEESQWGHRMENDNDAVLLRSKADFAAVPGAIYTAEVTPVSAKVELFLLVTLYVLGLMCYAVCLHSLRRLRRRPAAPARTRAPSGPAEVMPLRELTMRALLSPRLDAYLMLELPRSVMSDRAELRELALAEPHPRS
jgi:hypothetical protein